MSSIHHFTDEALQQYCEQHSTSAATWLHAVEEYTDAHTRQPHMLSGHLQGRFLSMISCMIQPACILELGTFTGYSALCLAEGLQTEGLLYSIESDAAQAAVANSLIAASPYASRIHIVVGKAAELIPTLTITPDLVFIDADKVNYTLYYDMLIDGLKPGAFIVADNVLFRAEVLHPKTASKHARAMHAFNQKIKQDPKVECVLLPVRDGLMLIRKK